MTGVSRRLLIYVQEEALEGVNYIRQSAHQVFWRSSVASSQTSPSETRNLLTGIPGNRAWNKKHQ